MTIDVKKAVIRAALAAVLLAPASAHADVLSEMNDFWRGAAVNTTGPTAFQGQASGHWTLGNLYLRAPVRSEQIATVNLPSSGPAAAASTRSPAPSPSSTRTS